MNHGRSLGIRIVALLIAAVYPVMAQTTQPANNQPASGNADQPAKLENIILNDFESAEDWRAFGTSPLGTTKIKKTVQQGPIEDVYNPQNLTEEEKERFKPGVNNVLGVKTYFKEKGFDRVEVRPPHEYVIKGLGRQLSVWVLGRNFRHTLYAKFRDYRGVDHKLRIGKLDFLGWRKLTLTIPGWLPQSTRYALFDKNLKFVSLYVECDNHEPRGDFYFYIDDLVVKVDKSEMGYPGSLIRDTW